MRWTAALAMACASAAGCKSDPTVPAETDADTDTDVDSDTDADSDSDTDADTDSDTDADSDSDTDADSDADADADTDTDSDTDSGFDWDSALGLLEDSGILTLGDSGATLSSTQTGVGDSGLTDITIWTQDSAVLIEAGDGNPWTLTAGDSGFVGERDGVTVTVTSSDSGLNVSVDDSASWPGGGDSSGRPLPGLEGPLSAPGATRTDWMQATLLLPLSPTAGAFWRRLAAVEHASVAAFARVTLELMALGAPADLLAAHQQAALDEIEHARNAFAIASSLLGESVGPGRLDLAPMAAPTQDLVTFAVATFREGCLAETLSVAEAIAQLEADLLPAIREAVETVVRDETRHASLAWRTVRWAIDTGGEPVRAAIAAAWRSATPGEPVCFDGPATLGVPEPTALRRSRERIWRQVVEPSVEALLAA